MLMLAPPLLVRVTDWACCVPTVRVPKDSVTGFTTSCPDPAPVPDRDRVVTGFDAVLLIVIVPSKVPAALGLNVMLSVALCPAPIAIGRLGVVREKYLLDTEVLLIVADAAPEFVAATVKTLLVPALTLPKSRLRLPRDRLPIGCWPEPPELTP